MISPRVAITAAHCVREAENTNGDLSMPIMLTDGDGNYQTYNIVDIRANECWFSRIDPNRFGRYASDVAVLILDRDITPANGPIEGKHYLKPWVTAVDGSVVGDTFILAGWGQSGEVGEERDDSDQDRRMRVFHRGYNTVDRIRTNMIEYDLDDSSVAGSGAVYLESMGHYGDSGSGALYEEADGTLRIIGVKSNGSSTAYYGSHHEYTYIGDYHSSWI